VLLDPARVAGSKRQTHYCQNGGAMRVTPDQVLAIIAGAAGGVLVAVVVEVAAHLRGRVTPTRRQRRRQVARDVRALERRVR
jgi:hypothetical protein